MKNQLSISAFQRFSLHAVASVLAFSLPGCTTTGSLQSYVTPSNAQAASALVCSNALLFASDADRPIVADKILKVSAVVRSYAGGTVPTPTELGNAIRAVTGGEWKYTTLATSLSSVYGGLYPHFTANSKTALEYLQAIAKGCEDAAKPFLAPAPVLSEAERVQAALRKIDNTAWVDFNKLARRLQADRHDWNEPSAPGYQLIVNGSQSGLWARTQAGKLGRLHAA